MPRHYIHLPPGHFQHDRLRASSSPSSEAHRLIGASVVALKAAEGTPSIISFK